MLPSLLASTADVADLLLMRTWTLVIFPTPCLFTGEHPVVHINPSGESYGYGVVTAERLHVPVSTTAALVLSHPWADWPEGVVHGTEELSRRLNWAMLTHPSNRELLLHPDVEHHLLPSVAELAQDAHWPWGPDPESAAHIYMHYPPAIGEVMEAFWKRPCDAGLGPVPPPAIALAGRVAWVRDGCRWARADG